MARTLTRGAAALTIAGGILLAWGGPGTGRIAEVKAEATKTIYLDAGADVSRAVATAAPGSTVLLRGGSYPALTAPAGDRAAPVTVAAAAGQTVTMPNVNVPAGAANLVFQGLTLTGEGGPAFNIGDNAHNIQLLNSVVRDSGDAILIRPGVSNVLFEGNDISSKAPGATGGGIGLAFASTSTLPGSPPGNPNQTPISNVTIRNNTFHDIGSDAIRPANFVNLVVEGNDISGVKENGDHCDVLQVTFGGRDFIFRDNYVHDNAGQGLFIKDGQVTNARVENNIFVHNSLEITVSFFDTINLTLLNNTVWDNTAGNVFLRTGIRNVVTRNNVFQSLDADSPSEANSQSQQDYNLIGGGNVGARGPHDIKGTPKFVNAAGYDYRLAAGSPGIDAGNADGAPTYDKACRPRFDAPDANKGVGNPPYVDMGALEYQPGSASGDTAARFNPACAGNGPPGGAPTPTCCSAPSKTAKCTWLTVGKPHRKGSFVRIRVVPRRTATVAFGARVVWRTSKGARHADVRSAKVKFKAGKARTVHLKLGPKARGALARNKSARLALSATGSGANACKLSRTLAVSAS
jgi:Right handed beta helix region